MTPVDKSVLETLAFFAQFNRGLTSSEIHQLLWRCSAFPTAVEASLGILEKHGAVYRHGDLWSLDEHALDVTSGRKKLLSKRRAKALQIAKAISTLPYVESILLMNSTALQTLSVDSDIDFLIITKPGALYTARTEVVWRLKRLGLMKTHENYAGKACLGYWLTSDRLNVQKYQTEDHFAAYWIASMVPLYGIQQYRKFIEANSWMKEDVPNWQPHSVAHLKSRTKELGIPTRIFEHILYYLQSSSISSPRI